MTEQKTLRKTSLSQGNRRENPVKKTKRALHNILNLNYSHSMDARETDGAESGALLGSRYMTSFYHGNRVNVEELWRRD
ncbi:hypothetical protein NPIL_688101 [Nephila pilipes]|uniref:Uncharacterized protein n=1 Tax=Nephila pilipes TaxID=299642 RepID=A0A8X6MJJ4_NEPPI|nr:hypothetical protein NPIL_688101 [Nephila pilipes]